MNAMEYYIMRELERKGPFSIEGLRKESVTCDTLVWAEGFVDWKRAGDVEELAGLFETYPQSGSDGAVPVMPKTYLVESIVVTAFCCIPFGVVGIVNAAQVESAYYSKQYELAASYSDSARKWYKRGIWASVVCIVLYLLFIVACVAMKP